MNQKLKNIYERNWLSNFFSNVDKDTMKIWMMLLCAIINFASLLTVLFVGLKLTGNIDWSWFFILSPIYTLITISLILYYLPHTVLAGNIVFIIGMWLFKGAALLWFLYIIYFLFIR